EQWEVDDRHWNRGARQIGEGRARKQGTIVRVPVLPAYYLGVCAFARQRRRLIGLGGAAMGVAEDVQVGAVQMSDAVIGMQQVAILRRASRDVVAGADSTVSVEVHDEVQIVW